MNITPPAGDSSDGDYHKLPSFTNFVKPELSIWRYQTHDNG